MSDRSDAIHATKVYLAQSRAMKHRSFAFTLLEWARRARIRAARVSAPKQGDLFK